MKKDFFIVDSHAYLYKNYFALPPLKTSRGEEVGALYGFLRLILKIVREKKPQYLAVCYDSPGPTKREEKYPLYKANRPKTDKSLIEQINISWEILSDMGIRTLRAKGYEADDFIAVISQGAIKNGLRPVIVSNDKDIYSLISIGAVIFDGVSDEYYSEEKAMEKFKVPSRLIRDYLSLIGDASDNVPGAEGIGPKTAVALLNKYGSLEKIIQACEKDAQSDKNLMKVKKSLESVLLSWDLIGLDYSVPIDFKKEDYAFSGFKTDLLKPWAERLEFKELYQMLKGDVKDDDKQVELFSAFDNSVEKLIDISDFLKRELKEIYIAAGKVSDGEVISLLDISKIKDLLKGPCKKYIYDVKDVVKSAGISRMENFEDIKIAYYLAYGAERKPELERIMREFYPLNQNDPVIKMKELFESLNKILEEKKLKSIYEDIEKPLIFCLAEMENNGMSIDENRLREFDLKLKDEIEGLLYEFRKESKEEINLNSPKQVSHFIYEKLNLPLTDKQKSMFKTKTGYSTSEEALEALEPFNPLISMIIKYRELYKLKTSFSEVLLEKISNGRVHTVFDQTGTSTGRLSSSNPNLQNIPVKTEHGRLIRACFNASPGFALVSADYSQIDLRVLAHVSKDRNLIEAFEKGEDIHTKTAAEIFSRKPEEVDSNMRRIAKTVNFGIVYGQSPNGLSRELSIPQQQAAKYIEDYFKFYCGVKEWISMVIKEAQEKGYCENFLGRRRELPGLLSPNRAIRSSSQRIAVNMPIQSGSSDIIKKAMINIYKVIEGNAEIRLCSQVHDELIFEIKEEKVKDWSVIIKKEMENSYKLSVPLVVDIKVGKNWADMSKV